MTVEVERKCMQCLVIFLGHYFMKWIRVQQKLCHVPVNLRNHGIALSTGKMQPINVWFVRMQLNSSTRKSGNKNRHALGIRMFSLKLPQTLEICLVKVVDITKK